MIDKNLRPKIGFGVYIFNDQGQLLLTKRIGSHGPETWCPPGGHLESGESFLECAKREAKEEVDLEILEIEVVGLTNDVFDEQKHYVTIHVKALAWTGEAKRMEVDKCAEIAWFDMDKLPSPLFLSNKNFFEANTLGQVLK